MTVTRRFTKDGLTLFTAHKTQVIRCFSVTELRRIGTDVTQYRIETQKREYNFPTLQVAVETATKWQRSIDSK
jgi:hypothetical protein